MMSNVQVEPLNDWLFSVLLLGGILFLGLFNITVYLVRKKLHVHFYFGMICVFFVVWYVCAVAEFDLILSGLLSEQYKRIISIMCTTQMILYLNLYTMGTLDIRRPVYGKRLKIWARTLFAACLLMPFSATYMALLTFVIQLFNAVAQLYIAYDILKVAKKFLKDIRIMNIFFFLSICISSVMEVIGLQFRDHTIYLAFIMLGLQSIILALHYNQSIIRVEQANLLLERKVTERTSELVKKEAETIELISSISHDLRAPISVVGGYMELLQKDASMNKASHGYISNSLVRLWQMEKLTLDLFTLSQISDKNYTLQLERIKITDTIGQIEMSYKEQAHQKGIELKVNSEDLVCIADKMRLMQVLDNLVTNALSHASSTISICAKSNNDMIEIAVTDDGVGINPIQLPYVFDRYYKNRQQGSGIGLSIVKDLVHRMNGVVTVESEQNVETSFIFTLPLLSDESHS